MTKIQVCLVVSIMLSATAVIAVRHQNRLAFVALQEQEQQRDSLQAEWGRLMLEKATWTRQNNVADAANKNLEMTAPSADKIVTLDLADHSERADN